MTPIATPTVPGDAPGLPRLPLHLPGPGESGKGVRAGGSNGLRSNLQYLPFHFICISYNSLSLSFSLSRSLTLSLQSLAQPTSKRIWSDQRACAHTHTHTHTHRHTHTHTTATPHALLLLLPSGQISSSSCLSSPLRWAGCRAVVRGHQGGRPSEAAQEGGLRSGLRVR